MSRVLICDCGGTYTRAALCCSTFDLTAAVPTIIPNQDHESILDALSAAASGLLDGVVINGAVIAVAGQVMQEEVRIINSRGKQSSFLWPAVSRSQFQGWLNGKPVLLLNDLEASLKGILWLQEHARLQMTSIRGTVDLDTCGTIGLVVPGTGFGLAYACGDIGRKYVANSEAAHWIWSPGAQKELDGLEGYIQAQQGHSRLTVEEIVSGPGLSLLFDFFCDQQCVKVVSIPGLTVMETAKGNVGGPVDKTHIPPAMAAVQCFTKELGRHAAMLAMVVNATNGILLAGEIIDAAIDLVGSDCMMNAFDNCDWGANILSRTPIAIVRNRSLGLIGGMAQWEDGLNAGT